MTIHPLHKPFLNPQMMSGLLGNAYMDPMQAALQQAGGAASKFAGYTENPTSIGQMLGAVGGAATRGLAGAHQQNMAGVGNVMQMRLVQQKMDAAKAAAEKLKSITIFGEQMAAKADARGDPETAGMWRTNPTGMMGHLQKLGQIKAKPVTAQHSGAYKWASDMGHIPGTPAFKTAMETYEKNKGTSVKIELGDKGTPLKPGASDHISALWKQIDANTGLQDKLAQTIRLAAKTPTGAGAEWGNYARQWGASFGMDVDLEKITNFEQFRVLQMDFVMGRIAGTKGSISEKEMEAFKQAGPNISNTAAGNVIISKIMNEQARRENVLAMLEIDLLNKGKTRTEARRLTEAKRKEFRATPHLSEEELNYIITQGQSSVESGGGGVITLSPDGKIMK